MANKLKPKTWTPWDRWGHFLYPQVDNFNETFIGFHSCFLLSIKFWLYRFYVIVNHLLNRFSVIVNHLCVLFCMDARNQDEFLEI